MKRIICVLLTLFLVFLLGGCEVDDRAKKEDIISFVKEKEANILECIETGDFQALEGNRPILEISADGDCVDFYCGGMGFESGSMYVGFFYSKDNDMKAVWYAPSLPERTLSPFGDGYIWKEEWTDEGGGNTYYVEKICENIFYYEAHF